MYDGRKMSVGGMSIASMTTEFFKVKLFDASNGKELDYKMIKDILAEILDQHGIRNKDYSSLDINPSVMLDSVDVKEIIDIFDDEKYLFGRMCRKRENNAMIKRDYCTLEAEEVLTDAESARSGIEVYTFFIYDNEQGIMSVVNTKGAPGKKALNALCECYKPEYVIKFESIPNEEGIRVLYGAEAPEISRFEFDLPAPNAEFLQRVLGLDEKAIGEMIRDNIYEANIVLKGMPYKKIISSREKVREILDILISKKDNYTKAIVRGNSEVFGSRNFDLNSKYFTYPIEINRFRTVRGKRVEYSLQEIVDQFKFGLHKAYEDNYDIINAIANR